MCSSLSGYLAKKRYSSNRLCTMHAYSWRSRGGPSFSASMRPSSASLVSFPVYTCAVVARPTTALKVHSTMVQIIVQGPQSPQCCVSPFKG